MANYTYLTLGDRLPTVGIAQKLLRAHSIPIAADGIFGVETREAVLQFQHRKHITPTGMIGSATWQVLVQGNPMPIIDCIDVSSDFTFRPVRDPSETDAAFNERISRYERRVSSLYEHEYRDITAVGGDPITIGGSSNGTRVALEEIARIARANTFLLRFHGHGAPGAAGTSDGEGIYEGEHTFFNITEVRRLRSEFETVGDSLWPYGSVQFMHCSTGHGAAGRRFLNTLANIMQVPVTAAVNDQLGGGVDTFRFEGSTYTAIPGGGTLRSWCSLLPDFRLA